jgi:hypothetical protein
MRNLCVNKQKEDAILGHFATDCVWDGVNDLKRLRLSGHRLYKMLNVQRNSFMDGKLSIRAEK